MKILEALESRNLMVVKGNRWLVLRGGIFTVFEQHLRKVTDTRVYLGADEDAAVQVLLEGSPAPTDQAAQ